MSAVDRQTAVLQQIGADYKALANPLQVAITNTSVNTAYPDQRSYYKNVSTTDGFPVTGTLDGIRVGTIHTQRLISSSDGTLQTRYWNTGTSAWSAWGVLGAGGGGASTPSGYYVNRENIQEPITWMTTFQSGHGFGVYGNTAAGTNLNNTTGTNVIGTQMATVQSTGAGDFGSLNGSVPTIDMSGRVLAVKIRVSNPSAISQIGIHASDSGTAFTNRFQWMIIGTGQNWSAGWLTFFLPWSDYSVVGTPDRTKINAVQVVFIDNAGGTTTGRFILDVNGIGWIDEPRQEYPNGVLTISLDDAHLSQKTIAGPILASRGAQATLFPIIDQIGQTNKMTVAHIDSMVENGCEVGIHAFTLATHTAGWNGLSQSARQADMAANRKYILDNGWPGVDMAAYPNGTFDDATIADMAQYCSASRTTIGSDSQKMMPRAPMPYLLHATANVGGQNGPTAASLTAAGGGLDRLRDSGGWLNLVFHDFVTTVTAINQTTGADLATILDAAIARGIAIRTQGQVIAGRRPTQGNNVTLRDYRTGNPPPTGGGLAMFSRRRARRLPGFVGPTGQDSRVQPSLATNRFASVSANNAVASFTATGPATATTSTLTGVTPVLTAFYTAMSRVRMSTAATAATNVDARLTNNIFPTFLSNIANLGGFHLVQRWGLGATTTSNRVFVGMMASNAQPSATVEPTTFINSCGFAASSTSTNLYFMTNGASGTATVVDLGSSFPATVAGTWFFETEIFVPSGNASVLYWSITRLNDGLTVTGEVATATGKLPALATPLYAHAMHGTTTAAIVSMDVQAMSLETDN